MVAVLSQINSVPGIVGCMLCDEEGRPAAQLFPSLFDASLISEAAAALSESAPGLQGSAGAAELIELRYNDARIVIRKMTQSFLVILCTKTVNMQLLSISLNVAIKKLEKLFAASRVQLQESASTTPIPVPRPETPPSAAGLESTSLPCGTITIAGSKQKVRGVTVTVQVMKKSAGTYWDHMLDTVSFNRWTAVQISDFFNTGNFKKIKLTNPENGSSCKFPVHIIKDDVDHLFDGKAIVSLSSLERLGIKQGSPVIASIDIGGGIFGWEGI
jgi:predicted regulator of Ras-like GTPase activity (Roadblock/LC7/MglB family)